MSENQQNWWSKLDKTQQVVILSVGGIFLLLILVYAMLPSTNDIVRYAATSGMDSEDKAAANAFFDNMVEQATKQNYTAQQPVEPMSQEQIQNMMLQMQQKAEEVETNAAHCVQSKITAKQFQEFEDYLYKAESRTSDLCDSGKEAEATAFFKKQVVDLHRNNNIAGHIHNCAEKQHKEMIGVFENFANTVSGGTPLASMYTKGMLQGFVQPVKKMPPNICFDRSYSEYHLLDEIHM